jgi:hypothetical protein
VFTGHILNPGFIKSPGGAAVYPGNCLFNLIMAELYILKIILSIPILIKPEQKNENEKNLSITRICGDYENKKIRVYPCNLWTNKKEIKNEIIDPGKNLNRLLLHLYY